MCCDTDLIVSRRDPGGGRWGPEPPPPSPVKPESSVSDQAAGRFAHSPTQTHARTYLHFAKKVFNIHDPFSSFEPGEGLVRFLVAVRYISRMDISVLVVLLGASDLTEQ